jgi:hypothetical protein
VFALVLNAGFKLSKTVRRVARSAAFAVGASAVFATMLAAQDPTPQPTEAPFPDTAELVAQVMQYQKKVESLVSQYTFTDKITVYALDKNGKVRNQHTDTYYISPTAYEFFSLHIDHDGKALSQHNLEEQEKRIEKQMREDERKVQRNEALHPKDQILFADIIARSNFTPVQWQEINGMRTIVYDFQPKSNARPKGSLADKIAGDLKGKMWISPDEKEVVRVEFTSVSSLGMGILGNVKGFQGFTEQQKFHGELWMPSRQEYVASGRQLVAGFRIRQVEEYSDYLKATTDVFQQVRSPKAGVGDGANIEQ